MIDLARAFMPVMALANCPEKLGFPSDYHNTEEGKKIIKKMRTEFATKKLPEFLRYFSKALEVSGGNFFCGDRVTIVDCAILPQLRHFTSGKVDDVPSSILNEYPVLKRYIENCMEVPAIKTWYSKPHSGTSTYSSTTSGMKGGVRQSGSQQVDTTQSSSHRVGTH